MSNASSEAVGTVPSRMADNNQEVASLSLLLEERANPNYKARKGSIIESTVFLSRPSTEQVNFNMDT